MPAGLQETFCERKKYLAVRHRMQLQHTKLSTLLLLPLLLLLLAVPSSGQGGVSQNVWGAPLQLCDRTGYFAVHPEQRDAKYPTTGYFRNNECTASTGDAGAHFVCVTMPNGTTADGRPYSTFWVETGQAGSPEQAASWPKPGPWCIW